jgi:hypothetical protein
VAFSDSGPDNLLLVPATDAVFGTTQTYANIALGGQLLTLSSDETVDSTAGTTTDFIEISVPTNFVPSGTTIDGSPVEAIYFDFGNPSNAGSLTFDPPLVSPSYTGSVTYGDNTTDAIMPFLLFDGNPSLTVFEHFGAPYEDPTGISPYDVRAFTFSITYATPSSTVPEPAAFGILAVGGVALLLKRRATT